jgi:ribonuclease HI
MTELSAYTDGACRLGNPGLCCCGYIVYSGDEVIVANTRILEGLNTNNVSEYSGLMDLLEWAWEYGITGMKIYSDSKFVVETSQARWGIRPENANLLKFAAKAFKLLTEGGHTLEHVKGHNGNVGNEAIDSLLNSVLDSYQGIIRKKLLKRIK